MEQSRRIPHDHGKFFSNDPLAISENAIRREQNLPERFSHLGTGYYKRISRKGFLKAAKYEQEITAIFKKIYSPPSIQLDLD
jgi:hypothetical protein